MVKLELIWYDESVKITDYRKKNYEADLRFFWLIKKIVPVHIISLEWFIIWTSYGQKIEGKYFLMTNTLKAAIQWYFMPNEIFSSRISHRRIKTGSKRGFRIATIRCLLKLNRHVGKAAKTRGPTKAHSRKPNKFSPLSKITCFIMAKELRRQNFSNFEKLSNFSFF